MQLGVWSFGVEGEGNAIRLVMDGSAAVEVEEEHYSSEQGSWTQLGNRKEASLFGCASLSPLTTNHSGVTAVPSKCWYC